MSHQAVGWAYAQEIEPPLAKFVLVTLADYASAEGFCFPGQEKLSKQTGMSERAVRGHLAALEQRGILRRQFRYDGRGKRTSDGFWLVGFTPLPADIAASLPAESATSTERLPATAATSRRPTTGKKRHDYRQPSSPLPAESAATTIRKIDPSVELPVNHQEEGIPTSSPRAVPCQKTRDRPVYNAILSRWRPGKTWRDLTGSEQSLIGKITNELEAVGATAEQVEAAWDVWPRAMPRMRAECSPPLLAQYWGDLQKAAVKAIAGVDPTRHRLIIMPDGSKGYMDV